MPRERRRTRRRRNRDAVAQREPQTSDAVVGTEVTRVARPWWRPTVGVVTALCLGIYLGTLFASFDPGLVIATWIGVIGAGIGAGRLSRTWMTQRRDRKR